MKKFEVNQAPYVNPGTCCFIWLEYSIPDRSRGRSETKRDTLVLQGAGWA
jgi:hypothetical protein